MSAEDVPVGVVLRDAAAVLRERGWRRGGLGNAEARVCAVGALGLAAGVDIGFRHTQEVMALVGEPAAATVTFLGLDSSNPFALPEWNDRLATDGEQVAQVFEKAAAAWEEVAGLS